jgi:hypothetical protein
MSTRACDIHAGSVDKSFCAVPGRLCASVLHLYMCFNARYGRNCLQEYVLHLYKYVYKSLCCTCTIASVPHKESVKNVKS